jgi:ferric-dicitrate binding protein FerR (iron transport regulator)
MDSNELKILTQKYLDGNASPEEKLMLDQWYNTIHSGWPETVELNNPETEEDIRQRMYDNLHKNLFIQPTVKVEKPSGFSTRRLIIWIGSAAAIAAFMVFTWLWNGRSITGKVVIADKQLVSIKLNRITHINLPDGSKVWLNAGSIFRYPKSFSGKTRLVELVEGRAFFDIKHQSAHPFIVKTKNLNITVYGTSFDVRSYKNERSTRVSVVTGKVGITMPDNTDKTVIMLLPNQQVTISNITSQLVKEPTGEADASAWVKNNFVFEQESLGNVFKAIEREYNIKINVEDKKLLNEQISVKLNNLQPLDTIMLTLSFTKHFKYQMANDSTVIIK